MEILHSFHKHLLSGYYADTGGNKRWRSLSQWTERAQEVSQEIRQEVRWSQNQEEGQSEELGSRLDCGWSRKSGLFHWDLSQRDSEGRVWLPWPWVGRPSWTLPLWMVWVQYLSSLKTGSGGRAWGEWEEGGHRAQQHLWPLFICPTVWRVIHCHFCEIIL